MVTRKSIPLETVLPTLSTNAMQAFCQDMDGMLGIAMTCAPAGATVGTLEEIKSSFAKCAAVYSVQSRGALEGRFNLVLDKAGLFLLSGVVVMLPQDTIKQQCKQGTLETARKLMDTLKEIGNLLVGSWDRIFRDQLCGHEHLLQTDTQIADPWENPKEFFSLELNASCIGIVWEITVEGHPPFKCAAVFPMLKSDPSQPASQPQTPAAEESPAPQTEQPKAAEPTPAKSEPAKPQPAKVTQAESAPQSAAKPDPVPASTPNDPQPTAEQAKASPQPAAQPQPEQTVQTDHPVYEAIQQMVRSGPTAVSPIDSQILSRPARSVMQTRMLWLSPNDSVETALQKMQQNHTRYALIEEQNRMQGILSRGDLNSAVSPYLKSPFEEYRRPLDEASLQIRVKWFMNRLVHIADPDMPLWKVMEIMCRHEVRALPVQDSGGAVLGLITVPDIFRTLIGTNNNEQLQAASQPAQTVPDNPVQHAQEETR